MGTGIVWMAMPRRWRASPEPVLQVTVAVGLRDMQRSQQDERQLALLLQDWPGAVAEQLAGFEVYLGTGDRDAVTWGSPLPGYVRQPGRSNSDRRSDPGQRDDELTDAMRPRCDVKALNSRLWKQLFSHTSAFTHLPEPAPAAKDKRRTQPSEITFAGYSSKAVARSVTQHLHRRALVAAGPVAHASDAPLKQRQQDVAAYAQFALDVADERRMLRLHRPAGTAADKARGTEAVDSVITQAGAIGGAAREDAIERQTEHLFSDPALAKPKFAEGDGQAAANGHRLSDVSRMLLERNQARLGGGQGRELASQVDERLKADVLELQSRTQQTGALTREAKLQTCERQYGLDSAALHAREVQNSVAPGREPAGPGRPALSLAQAVDQVRDFVSLYRPLGLAIDVEVPIPLEMAIKLRADPAPGSLDGFWLRVSPRWRAAPTNSTVEENPLHVPEIAPGPQRDARRGVPLDTPLEFERASGQTWSAVWVRSDPEFASREVPGLKMSTWVEKGRLVLRPRPEFYQRFHVETLDVDSAASHLMQEARDGADWPEQHVLINEAGFVLSSNLELRELIRKSLRVAPPGQSPAGEATHADASARAAPDPVQAGEFFPSYLVGEIRVEDATLLPQRRQGITFVEVLHAFVHGNGRYKRSLRLEVKLAGQSIGIEERQESSEVRLTVELVKLGAGEAAGSRVVRVRVAPRSARSQGPSTSSESRAGSGTPPGPAEGELPPDVEDPRIDRLHPLPAPSRTQGVTLIWNSRAEDLRWLQDQAGKLEEQIKGLLSAPPPAGQGGRPNPVWAHQCILGYYPEMREAPGLPPRTVGLDPACAAFRHSNPALASDQMSQITPVAGSPWFPLAARMEHWKPGIWDEGDGAPGSPGDCRSFGMIQTAVTEALDRAMPSESGEGAAPPNPERVVSDNLFTFLGHSLGAPIRKEGAKDRAHAIEGSVREAAATPAALELPFESPRADGSPFTGIPALLPRLQFVAPDPGRMYQLRVSVVDLAGNVRGGAADEATSVPAGTPPVDTLEFEFTRHESIQPPTPIFDLGTYRHSPVPCDPAVAVVSDDSAEDHRRLLPPRIEMQQLLWHGTAYCQRLKELGWRGMGTFRLESDGSIWTHECARPRKLRLDRTDASDAEAGAAPLGDESEMRALPMFAPGDLEEIKQQWPYLPDPLARRVRARFIPDFADGQTEAQECWMSVYDKSSAWPDARPLRLVVARTTPTQVGPELRPMPSIGAFHLSLPAGWSGKVELSSCLEDEADEAPASTSAEGSLRQSGAVLTEETAQVLALAHALTRRAEQEGCPGDELPSWFGTRPLTEQDILPLWTCALRGLRRRLAESQSATRGGVFAGLRDLSKEVLQTYLSVFRAIAQALSQGARRPETALEPTSLTVTAALRARMATSTRWILDLGGAEGLPGLVRSGLATGLGPGLSAHQESLTEAARSILLGGDPEATQQRATDGVASLIERRRDEMGASFGDEGVAFSQVFSLVKYWDGRTDGESPFVQDIARGRNPLVSPIQVIRVRHAVRRPVLVPTLEGRIVGMRERDGATHIQFKIRFDPRTSGVIEIRSTTSTIEDRRGALTSRTAVAEEVVARVDVDPLPYHDHGELTLDVRHMLPDGRHRRVTYVAVAISRYADLYPASPASEVSVRSAPMDLEVPSVLRPPPVEVDRVVPVFDWHVAEPTPGLPSRASLRVERHGSGLRVRIARPWYVTGDMERLGVVLSARGVSDRVEDLLESGKQGVQLVDAGHPDEPMRSIVSVWGNDPIGGEGTVARALHPSDFEGFVEVQRVGVTALAPAKRPDAESSAVPASGSDEVIVLGFPVHEDGSDGTWYADVRLRSAPSYGTFVRLSVVRFQPRAELGATEDRPGAAASDTRDGLCVSERVLARPVQIWPRRLLVVTRELTAEREAKKLAESSLRISLYGDWTVRSEPLVMENSALRDPSSWAPHLSEGRGAAAAKDGLWLRPRNRYECLILAGTVGDDAAYVWTELARASDPSGDAAGDGAAADERCVHPDCRLAWTQATEEGELARWRLTLKQGTTLDVRLLVRELETLPAALTLPGALPVARPGEELGPRERPSQSRIVYAAVLGT